VYKKILLEKPPIPSKVLEISQYNEYRIVARLSITESQVCDGKECHEHLKNCVLCHLPIKWIVYLESVVVSNGFFFIIFFKKFVERRKVRLLYCYDQCSCRGMTDASVVGI